MKAAWYCQNGRAVDVLQYGELPDPMPAPGEVRVRLVTSGVNPSDVKTRLLRPPEGKRVVPHSDGAGVIDRVGEGVSRERLGQHVWIWNGQWNRSMGTACQYIALPQAQAVPLPPGIGFEAAACFGIPGMTAMHAIQRCGPLEGQTVLVTGAGNAVGQYLTQLAAGQGATVLGTVGAPAREQAALRAGAHHVLRYKTEVVPQRVKACTQNQGVDVLIDMDFASTAPWLAEGILKPHGRYVCYGSSDVSTLQMDYRSVLWRCTQLYFFLVYALSPDDRALAIQAWTALLERHALRTTIAQTFSLSEIALAHAAVETGQAVGNVVIQL